MAAMRSLVLLAVVACSSREAPPAPKPEVGGKPPDEMDERMRHCPLALDGAVSTLEDIAGGVRFTVRVPDAAIGEARRRAHHVVEFAAKRTRAGHGDFDAKGGGRMRNCPVVTDDVTITVTETAGGAQLDLVTAPERVDALRTEARERVRRFPFAGATITVAAPP